MARQVPVAISPADLHNAAMHADRREFGGAQTFGAPTAFTLVPSRDGLGVCIRDINVTPVDDRVQLTLRADDGAGGDVEDIDLGHFPNGQESTQHFDPPLIFAAGTRLQIVPAKVDGADTPDKYSVAASAFHLRLREALTLSSERRMPTGF